MARRGALGVVWVCVCSAVGCEVWLSVYGVTCVRAFTYVCQTKPQRATTPTPPMHTYTQYPTRTYEPGRWGVVDRGRSGSCFVVITVPSHSPPNAAERSHRLYPARQHVCPPTILWRSQHHTPETHTHTHTRRKHTYVKIERVRNSLQHTIQNQNAPHFTTRAQNTKVRAHPRKCTQHNTMHHCTTVHHTIRNATPHHLAPHGAPPTHCTIHVHAHVNHTDAHIPELSVST